MRRALLVAGLAAVCAGAACDGLGGKKDDDVAGPENTFRITVAGQGRVRDGGGYFDCGTCGPIGNGVCSGDASPGYVELLTATAAEGASFVGWTGDCTGSQLTCEVTITGHKAVTATFTGASCAPGGLGNLGGAPFSPASSVAVVIPATRCTVGGTTATFTGLLLAFGTAPDLCAFLQANGAWCASKAGTLVATFDVLKAGLTATPGAVGPGDYRVVAAMPAPDGSGNAAGVAASYAATSSTCGVRGSEGSAGTVALSTVDATHATGSLSQVAFVDGSTLAGRFDAPLCSATIDLCQLLTAECTAPRCVP